MPRTLMHHGSTCVAVLRYARNAGRGNRRRFPKPLVRGGGKERAVLRVTSLTGPSNCVAHNFLPYETVEFEARNFPEDSWIPSPCESHRDLFAGYPDPPEPV